MTAANLYWIGGIILIVVGITLLVMGIPADKWWVGGGAILGGVGWIGIEEVFSSR